MYLIRNKIYFDSTNHSLHVKGKIQKLSKNESIVLCKICLKSPKITNRHEIIESVSVWVNATNSDAMLNRTIQCIRNKLNNIVNDNTETIVTAPREGYYIKEVKTLNKNHFLIHKNSRYIVIAVISLFISTLIMSSAFEQKDIIRISQPSQKLKLITISKGDKFNNDILESINSIIKTNLTSDLTTLYISEQELFISIAYRYRKNKEILGGNIIFINNPSINLSEKVNKILYHIQGEIKNEQGLKINKINTNITDGVFYKILSKILITDFTNGEIHAKANVTTYNTSSNYGSVLVVIDEPETEKKYSLSFSGALSLNNKGKYESRMLTVKHDKLSILNPGHANIYNNIILNFITSISLNLNTNSSVEFIKLDDWTFLVFGVVVTSSFFN
ncbi:hypothetical protein L2726_004707 [Vibrio parahaemolyticus]|nr:hypothetical protein [Vibrio parahaemolyticus]